jgi:Domain of unknown function (DUF7007)
VHPALRAKDGWYEEDCCWAIVALTFPKLFTDYEQRRADTTIWNYYPDAWETLHGAVLNPGESCEKDRRDFERTHASDWVVISAIHSAQRPGMTECVATLGGRLKAPEERRYLVPSDEYRVGRCGFVIDEKPSPSLRRSIKLRRMEAMRWRHALENHRNRFWLAPGEG